MSQDFIQPFLSRASNNTQEELLFKTLISISNANGRHCVPEKYLHAAQRRRTPLE